MCILLERIESPNQNLSKDHLLIESSSKKIKCLEENIANIQHDTLCRLVHRKLKDRSLRDLISWYATDMIAIMLK